MNRQTVTIGAVLFAAVIVVFGALVYFEGDREAEAPLPTGPGRATEARRVIADIEQRRADDADAPQPVARTIEPVDAGNATAARGSATAPPPDPAAGAPTVAGDQLDAAYERAEALQAAGQLDDAQVLYFFGARRGHARSAFKYAEINDPNHHSPETSLLAEPDAFQAFRWYTAAGEAGMTAAAARLDALHEWAIEAAAAGDSEAERLLLQWE
jgi:hypothetical protein